MIAKSAIELNDVSSDVWGVVMLLIGSSKSGDLA